MSHSSNMEAEISQPPRGKPSIYLSLILGLQNLNWVFESSITLVLQIWFKNIRKLTPDAATTVATLSSELDLVWKHDAQTNRTPLYIYIYIYLCICITFAYCSCIPNPHAMVLHFLSLFSVQNFLPPLASIYRPLGPEGAIRFSGPFIFQSNHQPTH